MDVKEDVIENLQVDLQLMKEKFNVNFELTAAELVNIVEISAEVSGRDDNNDSEDDDSDKEEPTEMLTKPDFKYVMNVHPRENTAYLRNLESI